MQTKEFLNWTFFVLLTFPLGILSCEDCSDCGPSTSEPYVNFRFFNIDSLRKVEDTLLVLEDSLGKVIEGIDSGNTDLDSIRTLLEADIDYFNKIETDIKNGKVKIEEVVGPNGEGPIYFRDSLKNDSLTVFEFPLDMNHDTCTFIIRISEREDGVGLKYTREPDAGGSRILMRLYDIEVTGNTYDSARVICSDNVCNSNETQVYIYF